MKRVTCVFLLFLLTGCTFSAHRGPFPNPIASDNDSGLRVLGGEAHMFATGLIQTTDNHVMVLAYQMTRPVTVLVMKLDQEGKTLWQKSYRTNHPRRESPTYFKAGVGNFLYWASIIPASGGGAVIAFDTVLMEIDSKGEVKWSMMYLPPEASQMFLLNSIARVKGGYLLAGELIRTKANLGPGSYSPEMIEIQTSPGGNIVTGALSYIPDGQKFEGVVLVKVDEKGQPDWMRQYPSLGGGKMEGSLQSSPGPNTIASLASAANGNAILGAYQLESGKTSAVTVVAEVGASNGDIAWVKTLRVGRIPGYNEENPTRYTNAFNRLHTLAVAPNGDILVVHGIDVCANTCTGMTPVVTRLSASGGHLWTRMLSGFRGGGFTQVRSISFDSTDLILAGFTTQFFEAADLMNYNILLMRAEEDGNPLWIRSIGKNKHTAMISELTMEMGYAALALTHNHLLVAGTTNSFTFVGDWMKVQPKSHYDLALLLTTDNGAFAGGAELTNIANLDDSQKASFNHVPMSVQTPQNLLVTSVSLSAEDAQAASQDIQLAQRSVQAPCENFRVSVRDNGKELYSSCSIFVDPRQDIDGDGIRQEFENAALALVNPRVEVDEEEDWLEKRGKYTSAERSGHYTANFTRIYPYPSLQEPRFIVFATAVAWTADYGGLLTGNPLTAASDHRGDSEKIFTAWRVLSEHTLRLEWIETSAHEDSNWHGGVWHVTERTCNRCKIANTSRETVGDEQLCGEVRFHGDHLLLQTAEDKHAMYLTPKLCEDSVVLRQGMDVWGEDCGWDPSQVPVYSLTQWKDSDFKDDPQYKGKGIWEFHNYNVGEPAQPYRLINDLGNSGSWRGVTEQQRRTLADLFPHESIWDGNLVERENGFCGGLTKTGINYLANPDKCSGTIGNKLATTTPELAEKMNALYRVSITTGANRNADTHAKVSLELVSPPNWFTRRPTRSTYQLEGEFQDGQTSIFYLPPSNKYGQTIWHVSGFSAINNDVVSPIEQVRLEVSGDHFLTRWFQGIEPALSAVGIDPDWQVVEIKITNIFNKHTWFWHSASGRWVRPGQVETFREAVEP